MRTDCWSADLRVQHDRAYVCSCDGLSHVGDGLRVILRRDMLCQDANSSCDRPSPAKHASRWMVRFKICPARKRCEMTPHTRVICSAAIWQPTQRIQAALGFRQDMCGRRVKWKRPGDVLRVFRGRSSCGSISCQHRTAA